MLAAVTAPIKVMLHALGLPKSAIQLAVRGVLVRHARRIAILIFCQIIYLFSKFTLVNVSLQGTCSVGSMGILSNSVRKQFGSGPATFLLLFTAVQFHLPFYMSRPLPNIMALVLTNIGLAAWIGKQPHQALALLTAAAVSKKIEQQFNTAYYCLSQKHRTYELLI